MRPDIAKASTRPRQLGAVGGCEKHDGEVGPATGSGAASPRELSRVLKSPRHAPA